MPRSRTDDATRLIGVDLARGLAILGMLWAHFAPDGTGSAFPDGRSAVLFAVLAGVSLGLLTGGARPPTGRARLAGWRTVAIRGLVLIVIGRLLVLLQTPIAVILDYYGVLFLLLLGALFAPRRVLAVLAAAAVVAGPVLVQRAGPDLGSAFTSRDPLEWPEQWLLTGFYPVVVFAAYALVGLIAARSDLTRRRTQLTMLLAGGTAAPLGYLLGGVLGVDAGPHANSTWEAIGSGGVALGVIGLLQLVGGLRPVRAVLSPVADVGAMPLTVYTLQVVVTALVLLPRSGDARYDVTDAGLLAAMVGGSLLLAVVWRRLLGRGPLERLLALCSRAGTGTRIAAPRPPAGGRAPAVRTIAIGLVAALVGAGAVSGVVRLIPVPESERARAEVASGSVQVRLDAAVLQAARLRQGTVGTARVDGGAIALPIASAQILTADDGGTGGVVDLAGSGFSLQRGSDVISVSGLLLDLDSDAVSGILRVNDRLVVDGTLLFALARPVGDGGASEDRVQTYQLIVPIRTAELIDEGLDSPVFADAPVVLGAAEFAVTG